jgi:periplasmic divalent cation tolerance protein
VYVAWTTVSQRPEAESLAQTAVGRGLAACVQIEGPIASHYIWQGRSERTEEFRLMFKCTADQLPALETFVLAQHPYETPEWIAVEASRVGEKYLSWAMANPTNLPFTNSQPSL